MGGHRVKAIALIDQVLRVVRQPPAASKTEMNSGSKDEPAEMQSGMRALQNAESDFERSGNAWGGRRAKAMSLISGPRRAAIGNRLRQEPRHNTNANRRLLHAAGVIKEFVEGRVNLLMSPYLLKPVL